MLDASVALCWLFADEQSDAAEDVFRQVHRAGAHAPALLLMEVGNALNVGMRRQRVTESDLNKGVAVMTALHLSIDDADARRVLSDAAPLARRFALSVYDAMYLELAMRLNLPLATLDAKLADAAQRAGVPIWHAVAL